MQVIMSSLHSNSATVQALELALQPLLAMPKQNKLNPRPTFLKTPAHRGIQLHLAGGPVGQVEGEQALQGSAEAVRAGGDVVGALGPTPAIT